MKFEPFADRVVVRLIEKPKKAGTIISLDADKVTPELGPFKGEVLAVGPGSGGALPMQVKKGDIVFFDTAREFEEKDWDVFQGILLLHNGQILGKEVK